MIFQYCMFCIISKQNARVCSSQLLTHDSESIPDELKLADSIDALIVHLAWTNVCVVFVSNYKTLSKIKHNIKRESRVLNFHSADITTSIINYCYIKKHSLLKNRWIQSDTMFRLIINCFQINFSYVLRPLLCFRLWILIGI